MALQTPVVTVLTVTEPQSKLYKITFRMIVADDTIGLGGLDTTYTANYKYGTDVTPKVAEVIKFFQGQIDTYKDAVVVLESAALATALASINAGLVV